VGCLVARAAIRLDLDDAAGDAARGAVVEDDLAQERACHPQRRLQVELAR
jgi:hypothetical protein